MSLAVDGYNIAISGTENARRLIGPTATYLDLGDGNGNLIRSGTASVVRVALWEHMVANGDGNSTAGQVFTESTPNYPTFIGFSKTEAGKCSRHVTATSSVLSDQSVLGLATPPGTYTITRQSNGLNFTIPTAGMYCRNGVEYFQAPTYTGATLQSCSTPVNGDSAGACTSSISEDVVGSYCVKLFELVVSNDATLVARMGLSIITGKPSAVKAAMASLAQTGTRNAPGRLYDDVSNVIYQPDTAQITLTLTFANNDAKAYLAQFPYFVVQYGDAANAMYLVHGHAFIA